MIISVRKYVTVLYSRKRFIYPEEILLIMLDSKLIKKINDFVYIKPRTIQEIAQYIEKNWRTANNYVDRIVKETGSISTRIFREGTRGALKIVYWSNIEKIHSTSFQEKLFRKIESRRDKRDFSPFDIYQYVDEKKRHAFLEEQDKDIVTEKQNLINILKSTQNQVLIFSGNLSLANLIQGKKKIIDILEELAKRNIPIKIITQIDITSIKNVKKFLSINEKLGKEMIEIRYAEQPLRCFIIDNKLARFKEIKNPADYKKYELKKKTYLFYDIYDDEWIEWLQKVFWNFFSTGISADRRINDLDSIEKLKI